MRLGCHSGIQRLIVYSFCFSFLFISWPKPVAANPVLAAGLLVRVIAQTTAKRAATQVIAKQAVTKYPLTEAVLQETIRRQSAATLSGMSRVAATVPANSSLRRAGQVTWAGLSVVGGVMTASELVDTFRSDDFQGVALGNGKYEVSVGGRTRIVDFQPSPNSPVILYGNDSVNFELDWNSVLSDTPLVKGILLDGKVIESFPVPSSVTQSNFLNNKLATYSADISSSSGDYFYIKDDKLSSVKDLILTGVVKHYETRNESRFYTTRVSGDNDAFDYVTSSESVDILDFNVNFDINSKNSEDSLFTPNAYNYFSANVPVIINRKEIKSNFEPCDRVKQDAQGNSIWGDYICTPPSESDYLFHSERTSWSIHVGLNRSYDGNYFNEKLKSSSVRVVSANELPHLLKDRPLDNSIVADLINDLLHDAAAQNGYEGVTVSDGDYVTSSEVDDALRELGHSKIDASDFFSPIQNIELDLSSHETMVNNNGGNGGGGNIDVKVDLGTDPKIKAPDLEKPPTGKEIAQPIIDGMSFISDYKISGKDASCPTVNTSFSLMGFDFDLVIDSHCDLIERNRKLIELITSLVWAFIALRIVLDA
ncbi:hypothetical protein ID852_13980 [Xenorhabdus sp. 42]|uniref:hypothetical protein n=1 Tax=Xenorhabdus szentirmaii TaxID=290112 RepID=UPI000C03A4AE|nr:MULTISPECIES: hypothetical protein [Xenorhabdus]MBD2791540.1 hypothetical protein [Xenorhabdus sp. CUL]MBD2821779.1 hypothetical protein [Xenorhabdus sp. 42]PHM41122.1 hypothetical protein Xszus_00799 [Xenorhabdus szentirmaii]